MAESQTEGGMRMTIEQIKEEVQRRKEVKEREFNDWWNNLSPERQEEYKQLRIFDTDRSKPELNDHLYECRSILDLIYPLASSDGRKIIPVAMAIHGTLPVVFAQFQGHETEKGRSMNEITQGKVHDEQYRFYSDVDTTEYGLPISETSAIWKNIIDAEAARTTIEKAKQSR